MTGTQIAVVFSLVAGVAGAAQAAISGALGKRVGTFGAAGFGVILTALIVVAVAVILGRGGTIVAPTREPPWLWLAGVFGAVIVVGIAYAPPRIGTFATVALLIAGQLIAGAMIDAFGWFGSPRIPVSLTRLVGLLLVAGGAALTLKR